MSFVAGKNKRSVSVVLGDGDIANKNSHPVAAEWLLRWGISVSKCFYRFFGILVSGDVEFCLSSFHNAEVFEGGGVINQGWYRGDQKLVQLIFPVFPLCLQVV